MIRRLTRRDQPPAELVAGLGKNERAVSWADTFDGSVVLATSLGLWWPGRESPRRIEWQRIDKVVWRDEVLTVTEADVVEDTLLVDRTPVAARLTVPRDLPPIVRKRVQENIVKTERVAVAGGAVRFVERKQPGRDGTLWLARLEPGTPDDERVRAAIRARLGVLRAG